MTDLQALRDGWDQAARENPMSNICSSRGDWNADTFFAHGREEVDRVIGGLADILPDRYHALDFGCGLGRCTQALARYFYQVTGMDISSEMLHQARQLLPEGERVKYILAPNDKPTLPRRAKTFDLVYSTIVLQHMPHELQRAYIEEFLRVLKPDGIASFQLPTGPETLHTNTWLTMYGTPSETISEWVQGPGGVVLGDDVEGTDGAWVAHRYTIGRA